jgi:DNA-binding CsgD family transcriptional regulator
MTRARDISDFSEACVALYRPGLGLESYAERAFAFLARIVPAEFIAFGSLDVRTQRLDIGFDKPVAAFAQAMEAFGSLMGNYPLFRWDAGVNGGRPFCRSDFFSGRQFRELDIFAEVYAVLGIDNHCAVHVPCGPREVAFFGIERKGGPDFSLEERELLQVAQVHLGNARDLAWTRAEAGSRGASPELLTRAGLAPREADVLALLADGKANGEIASALNLQINTVKGYVKGIFGKIGVPNRLAAALWALRFSRMQEARGAQESERFVSVPTIRTV